MEANPASIHDERERDFGPKLGRRTQPLPAWSTVGVEKLVTSLLPIRTIGFPAPSKRAVWSWTTPPPPIPPRQTVVGVLRPSTPRPPSPPRTSSLTVVLLSIRIPPGTPDPGGSSPAPADSTTIIPPDPPPPPPPAGLMKRMLSPCPPLPPFAESLPVDVTTIGPRARRIRIPPPPPAAPPFRSPGFPCHWRLLRQLGFGVLAL